MSTSELQAELMSTMEQCLVLGDEIDSIPEDDEDQSRFKHLVQLKTKKCAYLATNCSYSLC